MARCAVVRPLMPHRTEELEHRLQRDGARVKVVRRKDGDVRLVCWWARDKVDRAEHSLGRHIRLTAGYRLVSTTLRDAMLIAETEPAT